MSPRSHVIMGIDDLPSEVIAHFVCSSDLCALDVINISMVNSLLHDLVHRKSVQSIIDHISSRSLEDAVTIFKFFGLDNRLESLIASETIRDVAMLGIRMKKFNDGYWSKYTMDFIARRLQRINGKRSCTIQLTEEAVLIIRDLTVISGWLPDPSRVGILSKGLFVLESFKCILCGQKLYYLLGTFGFKELLAIVGRPWVFLVTAIQIITLSQNAAQLITCLAVFLAMMFVKFDIIPSPYDFLCFIPSMIFGLLTVLKLMH